MMTPAHRSRLSHGFRFFFVERKKFFFSIAKLELFKKFTENDFFFEPLKQCNPIHEKEI
jgi:hypothetical protein